MKTFPTFLIDDYIRDYYLLEKLEFEYGYSAKEFLSIYRKSPIMTLRDYIQMGSAGKITENLYRDVQFQYDITNITIYHILIYYILGRHDEWTTRR
jgi:hypothetical protein